MKKAIVLGVIVFALALFMAAHMDRADYAVTALFVSVMWLEDVLCDATRRRTLKIAAASFGLAVAAGVAWPLTAAFVMARATLPYRRLDAPSGIDDADEPPIVDDIDDEEEAPPAA